MGGWGSFNPIPVRNYGVVGVWGSNGPFKAVWVVGELNGPFHQVEETELSLCFFVKLLSQLNTRFLSSKF